MRFVPTLVIFVTKSFVIFSIYCTLVSIYKEKKSLLLKKLFLLILAICNLSLASQILLTAENIIIQAYALLCSIPGIVILGTFVEIFIGHIKSFYTRMINL